MKQLLCIISAFVFACSENQEEPNANGVGVISLEVKELIQLPNQWQNHNAFTDLISFKGHLYVCFRSSNKHVYGLDGKIQIYKRDDSWNLIKTVSVSGVDLRDPKFSINNDKLHLDIHGSLFMGRTLLGFKDYLTTYDGNSWSNLQAVKLGDENGEYNEAWPWRIKWHNDTALTIGYKDPIFDTYYSTDGTTYFKANSKFEGVNDAPLSEAAIRVHNGRFYAVVRNGSGPTHILESENPLKAWMKIGEVPITNFGGPNFVFFDKSQILISGRKPLEDGRQVLIISKLNIDNLEYDELIVLPGGKDLGYPGLFIEKNTLYVSYYSTGEDGTKVSFATIEIIN